MSYLSKVADMVGDSKDGEQITVLIVEDEELVADMFQSWLTDAGYSVKVANGGEEALRKIDSSVDVALLDRRMPIITGDELLDLFRSDDIEDVDPAEFKHRDSQRIAEEYERKGVEDVELKTAKKLNDEIVRNLQEEDIDCQISMVTAIEPGFDIVEMDFDHYVVKDISEDRLVRIVEDLATLSDLDETVRNYQSLRWKMFLIEESCTPSELEDNEGYQKLKNLMEEVEETEDEKIQEVKDLDFQ